MYKSVALVCAFALGVVPATASAQSTKSFATKAGAGCLEVQLGQKNADGSYNVIAWPGCHGGINQSWERVGKNLQAKIDGKPYCLALDPDYERNAKKAGLNVVATPDCDNAEITEWRRSLNGYAIKAGGERRCLDVALDDKRGHKGAGRNVVAHSKCSGSESQRWVSW